MLPAECSWLARHLGDPPEEGRRPGATLHTTLSQQRAAAWWRRVDWLTFSKAERKLCSCFCRGARSSSWMVRWAFMHASTSSRKGCCHWRPYFPGVVLREGKYPISDAHTHTTHSPHTPHTHSHTHHTHHTHTPCLSCCPLLL